MLGLISGLPPITGWEGPVPDAIMWVACASIHFITGCSKLIYNCIMPYVVHSFILMIGWGIGYALQNRVTPEWMDRIPLDSVVVNCLPMIFFNATYKIDYHTLINSIGIILLISIPLMIYHYTILIVITHSVLNESYEWSLAVIWILAIDTSPIHVDYCVTELNKVQGQMRVLQLMLLGERLISFAIGTFIRNKIRTYYDPNFPVQVGGWFTLPQALGLMLLTAIISIVASYLYKCSMRYFYKDNEAQATLTVFFMYLIYWVTDYLKGNGGLAILIFGVTVGYLKIKFSSAAERFFECFWKFMTFIVTSSLFIIVGFYLGTIPHWGMLNLGGFVFLLYVIIVISRGLGFVTIYPIMKRIGLQISMKHFVIATIGVSKSSLCLAYAFLDRNFTHGYTILLITTIIYLASTFFNIVLLQKYLDFFGLYKMSHSRLINMNVAMVQVNESRDKVIRSLKMDRLIADSNWFLVDSITKLAHPYRYLIDDNSLDLLGRGMKAFRSLFCRECAAENEIPPTTAELEDMILEAKQRILKAQLVCFAKQYENGTLSRQGYTVLNDLVEGASVKEDPILSYKDLKIQREGTRTLKLLKAVFGNLFTITSVTHRFIPTNVIRATCFQICNLRSYNTVMACVCLIDMATVIYSLLIYYGGNKASQTMFMSKIVQSCDITFFFIFLIDFIICILGIGVVQYFSKHVNNIEFAVGLLIRANQLAMYAHTCYVNKSMYNVFNASHVIFVQKTLMLARISRVYVFIVALIPKVMVLIDKKLDQDLIRWYDIGKAYMISLNRAAYFLHHISENETVHNTLLSLVEKDREMITRELGLIQKGRSTIAQSNKTLHAIRHVIISMGDCIASMKDEGLLDPTENRSLVTSVEMVKKRLLNFSLVPPCSPEVLLQQVSWLYDDSDATSFLLKHVRLSSYNEGEKIIYYGDDPIGLYMLVSGMVRVNYITTKKTITNVTTQGILPNCDYFTNLNFSQNQTELVVSGNLLGECGLVTGRRFDMDVVCETWVQVYYIPSKILKTVVYDSGNATLLQAKIWKSIGVRIAIHLLHTTSRFRGWPDNKILMYLQRGIVPSLDGVDSLHLSEFADDVILIEGKVMDQATRNVFTAPMCIPRLSSQKLLLPGTSHWDQYNPIQPKLLIIPNSESEMEDMMSNEGLFKYVYQDYSEKWKNKQCGTHSMPGYVSRLIQAQRRKKILLRYMDFMPTVSGAVENNLVSSTYIDKLDRTKTVKPSAHPRMRHLEGVTTYTQDITEQSEVELIKDEEEDEEITTTKRSSSRQKSASRKKMEKRKKSSRGFSVSSTDRSSSYYHSSSARGDSKRVEIVVIEEDLLGDDLTNVKAVQTFVHMKEYQRGPSPVAEVSNNMLPMSALAALAPRSGRLPTSP